MAFLENITKKVTETAMTAAKKSGELVETTKINIAISSEEEKINKIYTQIGKEIYNAFEAGGSFPEDMKDKCEEIKMVKENIEVLKKKVQELRGVKNCTQCGAEMDRNTVFCSKCGAKNEVSVEKPAEGAQTQNFCPDCGKPYEAGSAFCVSCGKKLI